MSTAQRTFEYDLAVIGGGSGGYAAASTAARDGLNTVVIEGGEEVGGLCILRGCMPTKALLYAAEVMHVASNPQPWGIEPGNVTFDFGKVMERKNALIKEFADYRHEQLRDGKFKFIRGMAKFVDEHTLELSTGQKLSAANFVIATGSKIAVCPLPSLEDVGYLTSDSALKLKQLPKSIIVLGGGAVAVEFAQFFARFRVDVTLIQRSDHVLHDFDTDAAEELQKALRREGLKIYTGTKLVKAGRSGAQKEVTFVHEGKEAKVQAEEIFYALGRKPNIDSLNLEKLRVRMEDQRILVDTRMQSSVAHIYAVGDCTGLQEIVHIAVQQGEVAGRNIVNPHSDRRMDYRCIAMVIFTDPQVAFVGLTVRTAKERKIPYLKASYPFWDHGKSLIMEAKEGFVKLLADPKSGEIIGGCCVGPAGGELIHEIIAAMYKRMTVHELAAMPHYHPTLAEIWTYPAEEIARQIPLSTTTN